MSETTVHFEYVVAGRDGEPSDVDLLGGDAFTTLAEARESRSSELGERIHARVVSDWWEVNP